MITTAAALAGTREGDLALVLRVAAPGNTQAPWLAAPRRDRIMHHRTTSAAEGRSSALRPRFARSIRTVVASGHMMEGSFGGAKEG